MRVLIGRNPVFYQRIKQRESVFYCFSLRYLFSIKQIKKPKLCITLLSGNTPDIWEHSRNEKKHSPTARVFSAFALSSLMPVSFYHSVMHGLGFFIC